MKLERFLLVVAVLGVAALLVLAFSHRAFGATTPSTTTADYATESIGSPLFVLGNALTGPNSTGATGYANGNVQIQAVRQSIVAATTTPCTMQNPLNATSTLLDAYMNVTTGTSTAVQFVIATSSLQNATTSVVSTQTLGAGLMGTLMVGESASTTGLGIIVPPTGYVTFGVALNSGSGGLATVGGTCGAVFQTTN